MSWKVFYITRLMHKICPEIWIYSCFWYAKCNMWEGVNSTRIRSSELNIYSFCQIFQRLHTFIQRATLIPDSRLVGSSNWGMPIWGLAPFLVTLCFHPTESVSFFSVKYSNHYINIFNHIVSNLLWPVKTVLLNKYVGDDEIQTHEPKPKCLESGTH